MEKENIFLFYLFFIFTHISVAVNAQSSKTIEYFRSKHLYSQIINGQGTTSDSIVSLKFNNQNINALHIKYLLQSRTKYTTLCNYNTATHDFSFKPSSFSLFYRGGNKYNYLSFRLWEDLNRNGIFDDKDELYTSTKYSIGDTLWHKLVFLIKDFKITEGKGNGKIDFNRIRAWEIILENPTSYTSEGEVEIANIQFNTYYQAQNRKEATVTGTFVVLSMADSLQNGFWDEKRWIQEIKKMKRININKIFIQYSVYQNISWYNASLLQQVTNSQAALTKLMKATETEQIQLFVGLAFSENWNKSDKSKIELYENLFTIQKQTIDELFSQFGNNPNFKGWYIPQEINDLEWQNDNNKMLLFSFLQRTSAYAHTKDAKKPVVIAPFFNLWQPADILGVWYDELLRAAPDINWIYIQDGVGSTYKNADVDIPLYFSKIKKACDKHKRKFGVTLEVFQQIAGWPINAEKFKAIPANPERINQQLKSIYPFSPHDVVVFDWQYLSDSMKAIPNAIEIR